MNVTPTATKSLDVIHLDTYTLDKVKFITIIDSFFKYAQAFPLKSLAAFETSDNLV